MNKKQVKIIIGTIFFIGLLQGVSTIYNQPVRAGSMSFTLTYNSWLGISSGRVLETSEEIDWAVTSSNNLVGLDVWFFSEYNYEQYSEGYSASGYHVSNSATSSDSGTFTIPGAGIWYVVIEHNDGSASSESTKVTLEIDFPSIGFFKIIKIILIVGAGVVVGIIVTVVIIVKVKKRKRQAKIEPMKGEYQGSDPIVYYCSKCSKPYELGSVYCQQCGSKLSGK